MADQKFASAIASTLIGSNSPNAPKPDIGLGGAGSPTNSNQPPQNPLGQGLTPLRLIQSKALYNPSELTVDHMLRFMGNLAQAVSSPTSDSTREVNIWAPLHYKGLDETSYVHAYWEKRDSLEFESNAERLYPTDIAYLLDQVVGWLSRLSTSRPKVLELIEEFQRQPLLPLGKTDQEGYYSEEKFLTTYSSHLIQATTKVLAALGRFKAEIEGQKPESKVTLDDVVKYINSQDPTKIWILDLRVKDVAKTLFDTADGSTTIHFSEPHFKPYGPDAQNFETPEIRKVLNAYYTRFREVFKELKPELREKVSQTDRLLLNEPQPGLLWFKGEIDELQKTASDSTHGHNFIEFFDRVIKALTATSQDQQAVADASDDAGGEDLVPELHPSLMSRDEVGKRLAHEAVTLLLKELQTDPAASDTLRQLRTTWDVVEVGARKVLSKRPELAQAVDEILQPFLEEIVKLSLEYQRLVADDPSVSTMLGSDMVGYDPVSGLFQITALNFHEVLGLAPKVVASFWEKLTISKSDLAVEAILQAKLEGAELQEAMDELGRFDGTEASLRKTVVPDNELLSKLVAEYQASLDATDPRRSQSPDQWWLSMSLAERREFLRSRAVADHQLLLVISDRLALEVVDEYLTNHGFAVGTEALGPEISLLREQIFSYLLSQPLSEFSKLENGELRLAIWSRLKQQLVSEVLPTVLVELNLGVRRAINAEFSSFNSRLKAIGLEGNQRLAFEQSLDALLIYSRNPRQFVEQLTVEKTHRLLGVQVTEEQLSEFKTIALYFLELRQSQLAIEGLVASDEFSESEWQQVVAGVKTHGTKNFIAIVFGEDVTLDELEDLKTSDPEAYQQQLYRQKYLAALWLLLEEEQRQAIVGEAGDTSHYPPNFNMSMVFSPDWEDPVGKKEQPSRVDRLRGKKPKAPARETAVESMGQSPESLGAAALKQAGKLAVKSIGNYLTGGTLGMVSKITGISEEKLIRILGTFGVVVGALVGGLALATWGGLLGLLLGGPLAAIGGYLIVQKIAPSLNTFLGGPAKFASDVAGLYQDVRHTLFGTNKTTTSTVVAVDKPFFASGTGQLVVAAGSGTAATVLITQIALQSALLQPLPTINKSGQVSPFVTIAKQASPGVNFERFKDQTTFSQTVAYSVTIEPTKPYGLVIALGDNSKPLLVDEIKVSVNEELRPNAPTPSIDGKKRTFIDLVTSNCGPSIYNGPSGQEFINLLIDQGIFNGSADVAAGTFSGSLILTSDQKMVFPPYCETYTEEVQHSNVTNTFYIEFTAANSSNTLDITNSFAQTSEILCFGECPQFRNGCWPTDGIVTTEPYQPNLYTHRTTDAVDIANSSANIPVFSPFAGTATFFTDGTGIFANSGGPYGNHVWLVSSDGSFALIFAHLKSLNSSGTKAVVPGEFLGYMGSTGNSTGQHLHYEVRVPTNTLPSLLSSDNYFHAYQDFTTREMGPDGDEPQPYSASYSPLTPLRGTRQRPTVLDTIVPDGVIEYGQPTRTCWQLGPGDTSEPINL